MPKKSSSRTSSDHLFNEIFNNISSGVAIYDSPDDGNSFIFKDMNKAGLDMDKVRKEDIVGKDVTVVFPGVEEFGLLDVLRAAWKTEKPQSHPISLYRDEHISSWRENHVFKLSSGEVVAIYRDATMEKKLSEEMLKQASLLQGILDNIPDIVGIQRPDHTIVTYNQAGYDFLGVQRGDIEGKKCYELIGRRMPCEECATKVALETKKAASVEKYVEELNMWLECRSMPIIGQDGEVELIIEMLRDISSRKNQERAIEESNKRTELFFRLVPSAIFTVDTNRIITKWNAQAERITGYTEDEVLGEECTIFAMSPCNQGCGLFGGENQCPIMARECTIKTKEGKLRIISKNADLLKNSKGKTIGGIESFNDVTEQKKLEQLRDDFVSITTHDLRTPLSVLMNALELLKMSVGPELDENDTKWLGIAMDHTRRMTKMTNDLLDVSKYEAGKMELNLEKIVISDLIIHVAEAMLPQFTQKQLEQKVNLPDTDVVIEADREKIEQMLINLIGNALKFTMEGHILIGFQEKDDRVELTVEDTGEGIPEEELSTIFDKFMQVTKARRSKQKGTGLGLSIVESIVDLHGGRVSAKSPPGAGATFTITLPKKQPQQKRSQ